LISDYTILKAKTVYAKILLNDSVATFLKRTKVSDEISPGNKVRSC